MAADGLGEGDDEAQEVFSSEGVVEAADVVRGLDSLRWGLEMKRRRYDGDLLGLGDRGEDYGLLGMVWGEVDGRGSDGAVVRWRRDFGP